MRWEPTCPSVSAWYQIGSLALKSGACEGVSVEERRGMMHSVLAICEAVQRRSRPQFYTPNLGVKKLALGLQSRFDFSFSFLL